MATSHFAALSANHLTGTDRVKPNPTLANSRHIGITRESEDEQQ
jgi:hypothetical protein